MDMGAPVCLQFGNGHFRPSTLQGGRMLQRLAAWVLAFLTGCLGSPEVDAQSIELVHEQAQIGRPLLLRWQVRPFDLDPSLLKAECLEVHLSTPGEDALPLPVDELQLRPLAEQGKALLEIRSNTPVLEPIVSARVALNCGATLNREFSILVAPEAGGPQNALSKPSTAGSATSATSALSSLSPRSASTARKAPDPPRQADRLQLDTAGSSPSAQPLREDQVRAIAQAVAALLLQAPSATPALQPGSSPERSTWDSELRQLRQDQQQARAQMATLQLRLERQQEQLPTQWTSALLGAAGLLAAAALVRLWREHRLPRWTPVAPHPARSTHPRPSYTASSVPTAPAPRTSARQRRQEPAFHATENSTAEESLPAEAAATATHTSHGTPLGSLAAQAPIGQPGQPPEDDPPVKDLSLDWPATDREAITARGQEEHSLWAAADFGQPDLDAPSRSEAIERLDQMARDGYHGACIALLEHALQSRPGKNPRLLLRLLELYRHLQQEANHDRVAAQLEALFNLRVPLLSQRSLSAPELGWELDHELGLAELSAVWDLPDQALACLQPWLLPGTHPRLSLQAFEDALCLFDLAREKLRDASPDTLSATDPTDAADVTPAGMGPPRSAPPIDWTAWPGAAAA